MLAWILNTKPDNAGSNGSTIRSRVSRSKGPGAWTVNEASNSSTPKLLMADPKTPA